MICRIFLLAFVLFCANSFLKLKGQENNADFKMPDIVPVSPEAKGIGKFGDVPVGTYTGVPDISIPIYTVKSGALSLPITLSYHATGVEVSQEATWVGLGWNLVAGGAISYIPVGGNDQLSHGISNEEFISLTNYMYMGGNAHPMCRREDWYAGWGCAIPAYQSGFPQVINSEMIFHLLRGGVEPDVYSANFLNYSFKFIKHPIDGSYFFIGQKNKCTIQNCEIDQPVKGFVITGEDGTKYFFEMYVYSTSPSSWFLTRIISAKGDVINLKYKEATTVNLPILSETYTISENNTVPRIRNFGVNNTKLLILESIETLNELIIFESDQDRSDLRGALKLNKITIRDKINQVDKYSYCFKYNYFKGSTVGGDYLNDGSNYDGYKDSFSEAEKSNRLKLDSLILCNSGFANNKYAFSYYDSIPLPRKTSFAFDHWGYYNKQENISSIVPGANRTILPSVLPLVIGSETSSVVTNPSFYAIKGAVRGASNNVAVASAGMLKSIQYPTKGKTVFNYEPHDYSNYRYLPAENELMVSVLNTNVSVFVFDTTFHNVPNPTLATFTLTKRSCVNFTGYTDFNDGTFTIEGVNVPGYNTQEFGITDPNPSGSHVAEWNRSFYLEAGTYKFSCSKPWPWLISANKMPLIAGNITVFDYNNINTPNAIGVGGGLRVKTIVNYDENNKVVSSKKYTYVDDNGQSSGKLIIPLKNFDAKNITIGECREQVDAKTLEVFRFGVTTYYTAYTIFGNSYVPLSAFSNGNNVGYGRVEVQSCNNRGENNGKEVFYYDNYPAGLYFDKIPFFANATNGDLLKKVILNANGDTLVTEINNYCMIPGSESSEVLNAYAEDLYKGSINCCTSFVNLLAYVGRYNIYVYPTRNYYNALNSKETTNFFSGGKVKQSTHYTYNPKNYCVQSIIETTNKGVKYTNLKYPVDYSDNIHSGMVLKNQISNPVEKVDSLDVNTKYKLKTTFALWHEKFYAPKKITATKGNEISPENSIVYDFYDRNGNVQQVHKNANVNISYLWGYNHTLPVAKIENASYNGLTSTYTGSMSLSQQQFSSSIDYNLNGSCTITEKLTANIDRSYNKTSYYGATYYTWVYNSNNEKVASFIDVLTKNETTNTFTTQLNLPAGQYTSKVSVVFSDVESGVTDFPGQVVVSIRGTNERDAGAPYYNSFEEDADNISMTYSKTGCRSHSGSFSFILPNVSGQSILSYWKKQDESSPWVYIEQKITANGQSITIESTGNYIDEVRVYPEGSLMTTYTYDPVYGITSQTDPNNITTYYEYDSFGRLSAIRDNDLNILKLYEYNYLK